MDGANTMTMTLLQKMTKIHLESDGPSVLTRKQQTTRPRPAPRLGLIQAPLHIPLQQHREVKTIATRSVTAQMITADLSPTRSTTRQVRRVEGALKEADLLQPPQARRQE